MGRRVENPFKEQGIPSWMRYLVTGLTGFLVAWIIFGRKGAPQIETTRASQLSSATATEGQAHLRPGIQTKDDDAVERFQNDDYIGSEEADDGQEFPQLDLDQYLNWVHKYYDNLEFESYAPKHNYKLNKDLLKDSLRLGCDYMVANQKEAGNFNYQYDFVKKEMNQDDSPVRQAGALWGMTLCFQALPKNTLYRSAVEKGIAFFQDHMIDGPVPGSNMIKYPGFEESQSGVNALYGLALIDYIRTIRDNDLQESKTLGLSDNINIQLAMTIRFLKYMQNGDLHFSQEYDFESEEKSRSSSPYYDGETLLCLVKAAKYVGGYEETLVPIIEEAAPVLAKTYTLDTWRKDEHDSTQTKGFYQWSSMVFAEYYFAKWEDYEYFGDLCLVLAHWIVHTHDILDRQLNTGYAFEGIFSAFSIARDRESEQALADLGYVIDEGLYKLTR